MRKRNKGRILSRPKDQRKALLKLLAANLFLHGKIKTTEAKAKEMRIITEKLISKAKDNKVLTRRFLAYYLPASIVKKVIEEIAPSYLNRSGGYTRIIKLGQRKSDGARMAIIELVK